LKYVFEESEEHLTTALVCAGLSTFDVFLIVLIFVDEPVSSKRPSCALLFDFATYYLGLFV